MFNPACLSWLFMFKKFFLHKNSLPLKKSPLQICTLEMVKIQVEFYVLGTELVDDDRLVLLLPFTSCRQKFTEHIPISCSFLFVVKFSLPSNFSSTTFRPSVSLSSGSSKLIVENFRVPEEAV